MSAPGRNKTKLSRRFRQLWGEKAELRRFKDGSISETVAWDIARPEDAASIPNRIVQHLVERHCRVKSTQVHLFTAKAEWSKVLQIRDSAREATSSEGAEKLGFRPVLNAYDELVKVLKSLDEELPLSILHITPAAEALRYSSTFIPHPIVTSRIASAPTCLQHLPVADVIVQLESSARWPDDLAAVQKVKLALMDRLAGILSLQLRGAQCGIAFDPQASEIEDSASLEVLSPAGVCFRLRIFHERERVMLERIIEDKPTYGTSLPKPSRRLVAPALEAHIRRFDYLPRHHAAIAPLHHLFPSFSSATRLLKRWFAAHLLSLQITPETTELLMARIYLCPGTYSAPASAVTAFLRAIQLLADWSWLEQPLIIPLLTAVSDDSRHRAKISGAFQHAVGAAFEQLRARDKEADRGAWVIATEQDQEGVRWTRKSPSRVIAARVSSLASATLQAIRRASETSGLIVKVGVSLMTMIQLIASLSSPRQWSIMTLSYNCYRLSVLDTLRLSMRIRANGKAKSAFATSLIAAQTSKWTSIQCRPSWMTYR